MSDQWNEFDRVFSDRLGDQIATPPPSVWENIQQERTFGHVVTNRISNSWRILGTLLMLLLAGGSSVILFGGEEYIEDTEPIAAQFDIENFTNPVFQLESVAQTNIKTQVVEKQKILADFESGYFVESGSSETLIEDEPINEPDIDLVASMNSTGFTRPRIMDKRLAAYIETLDGWESTKPTSYTRYQNMSTIPKKWTHQEELVQNPRKAFEDYDYVKPVVDKVPFKDRLSFIVAITPQSVRKIMTAEFNMSSSYLRERNKRERTRFAYTFSAGFQYQLKNNKFLESGIHFTQIYEEMHFEGEKRFSNQYDFFEVPILFGHEERNGKWGWHLKAGLGIQVFNSYKGYILKTIEDEVPQDQSAQFRVKSGDAVRNIISNNHRLSKNQARHEVLDLNNEEENPFKSSGVFNAHIATGLTYFHDEKTSFLLSPYYRRSVNSITKESARFKENISYMGISIGARFKF